MSSRWRYRRCEPCQVSWAGTEDDRHCWVCGMSGELDRSKEMDRPTRIGPWWLGGTGRPAERGRTE